MLGIKFWQDDTAETCMELHLQLQHSRNFKYKQFYEKKSIPSLRKLHCYINYVTRLHTNYTNLPLSALGSLFCKLGNISKTTLFRAVYSTEYFLPFIEYPLFGAIVFCP